MAFCGLVLGYATAAHACGSHGPPDSISAYPGLAFFRPDLILLYPILSGTLERPIYSAAGFRTATWGYSVQANLLAWIASSLFGFVTAIVFWRADLLVAVYVGAPLVALCVKLAWFRRVPCDGPPGSRFGYFFAATLLSTLLIASLPMWMSILGTGTQSWALKTQPLKLLAGFTCAIAAIVLHVHLFSALRRDQRADVRRGFEVETAAQPMPVAVVVGDEAGKDIDLPRAMPI